MFLKMFLKIERMIIFKTKLVHVWWYCECQNVKPLVNLSFNESKKLYAQENMSWTICKISKNTTKKTNDVHKFKI
jgi:hypothetical protein